MDKLLFTALLIGVQFTVNLSFGQQRDSLLLLDEIEVKDTKLKLFSIGGKTETLASERIAQFNYSNIAELLTGFSGANIRSYGPGGVSIAALRGTGSSHTAVFWEGINLQSSANGSVDLTLLPVSFVDEVSLQYGGGGSLFGSGALGGSVHLGTTPKAISSGFGGEIVQQLGSFGSTYTGVNLRVKQGKIAASVRGFVNYVKNDFNYYNRFSAREEEQENASVDQQGILAEAYVDVDESNAISFKYWLQNNLVHLSQAASAGATARATQSDVFHRAVVNWQRQKGVHIEAKTAILAHKLRYDDKVLEPSLTNTVSWVTELETAYKLYENLWLDAGLANVYDHAEVDGYSGVQPARNRTALYLSSNVLLADILELIISIREAYNDGEFSPFLPSLGANYVINSHFTLRSKIARSYKIPTFNDLYWNDGGSTGNPALKPELGWSSEIGMEVEKQTDKWEVQAGLTTFSNHISQWIQWIPVNSTAWTPVNVEDVWSRGIEVNATYKYDISNALKLQAWSDYSFTRSTKVSISDGGNSRELDKQLIYTPMHQGKIAVDLTYKDIGLGSSQVYMGEQYVTGDNTRSLEPYMITNISLSYKRRLHDKHRFALMGRVQNIFDKNYEVRNARPMPGRNYHVSITYQFN